MRSWSFVWVALAFTACGGGQTPAEHPPEHGEEAGKAKTKGKKHEAEAPAPVMGKVAFVEPAAGAKVKSPVTVKFAVEGMTVRPAGEIVPQTGHHHLIVDGGPIPAGTVVPMDEKHLHFGKGQTETTVELAPGEHKLTMQFADGAHVSFGEAMAATVTVTVE